MWLGLVPPNGLLNGYPENPYVFKNKITHNVLMVFAAYLFALEARLNPSRPLRILFALLGIAALYNVLFMVTGKTGYLIVLVLAAYYLVDGWGRRGIAMAALFLLILCGAVYLMPSSVPHQRLSLAAEEIRGWNPDRAEKNSVGHRVEYYTNGLRMVREHPFLGVGTGGFPGAYAKVAAKKGQDATVNPHNEYLMVAVQLGAAGVLLMLWLFLVQWRKAAALPDAFARPAVRGLVLMILTASLVTSTLIDHTEGLFFVWMSALLFAGWNAAGGKERSEPCRCP
jgi:O-antigen ligase